MTDIDQRYAIPLDPDDVFEAVSNGRRRRVILSADRTEDCVSADDLAVELKAFENSITPSAVTGKQPMQVYIPLTQRHLDRLDEIGAVEYDQRLKQVRSTDVTKPLAEAVRRIETACYEPSDDTQEVNYVELTQ